VITQEQIQRLAQLRDPEYPVTSLFLNLNGGRDSRKSSILLKDLLKNRRTELAKLDKPRSRSVEQDFTRIERFVQSFDRKGTRALAIFASSGAAIWEVFPLARRVQDRLVVDTHPHIRSLSRLLNDFKRCGVVLLSRDHATIHLIHLGEIELLADLRGAVMPQRRESGFQGYLERRIERHSDDQLQRFIKTVAAETYRLHNEAAFDVVVTGGSQAPVAALENACHRYLSERLIGHLPLAPDASPVAIIESASAQVLAYQERRGQALTERVMHEAETGGLGVMGRQPTLQAVSQGRVAALLVAKESYRPGLACAHCSYLGVNDGPCPQCEADLIRVPDVIEEAVDRSLGQAADVFFVPQHEQLRGMGGLAALLRYR